MKPVKIEGGKKLSSYIQPMLAQPTEQAPFDNPDWIFELKLDGYRAIAEVNEKENKLYSRNGITYDKAFKTIFEALSLIPISAVLDGEIVAYDAEGKPDFQKLQNYKSSTSTVLKYHVFDCLEINGQRITSLPLVNRKELLRELLPESNVIIYCDHIDGKGKDLFEQVQDMNLEGVVAKKKNSRYYLGKRSSEWLKIKYTKTMEAVIVGYTQPKGLRNYFGALILGLWRNGELVTAGNVGTGFPEKTLKELHSHLQAIEAKKCPLDIPVKIPGATWVQPLLVCTVRYVDFTEDNILRHPTEG